jgi:hypothetical protein
MPVPQPVSVTVANNFNAQVVALAGGGYVVGWSQVEGDGSTRDWFRIVDNNGTAVGIERPVGPAGPFGPVMEAYANGNFEVDGILYDFSGRMLGGVDTTPVNQQILGAQGGFISEDDPTVAQAGAGYVQVSTAPGPNPPSSGSPSGTTPTVDVKWFDGTGAQTREVLVPVQPGGFDTIAKGDPAVATLTGGATVAVWDARPTGHNTLGQFEIIDAAGNQLGIRGFADVTSPVPDLKANVSALANGGFVVAWAQSAPDDNHIGGSFNAYFRTYDASGTATGPAVFLGESAMGAAPGVNLLPDGDFAVTFAQWTGGGQAEIDSHVVGPNHPVDTTPPGQPQLVVMDNAGARQGPVPSGGTTDDPRPEIRVMLAGTGAQVGDRVYWQFATPSNSLTGTNPDFSTLAGVAGRHESLTADDIARGYALIVAPQPLSTGDSIPVLAWVVDDWNNVSAGASTSFTVGPDSRPSGTHAGAFLQAQDNGSVLIGGGGDDILIAGAGADTMTGGAGVDRFVFNQLPPPAQRQITDFTPGVDMIDLGYPLEKAGYTGSNPLNGMVLLRPDGHGGTNLYLDLPAFDPIGVLVADLVGVAPSQIGVGDVVMGAATPQDAVQMGFDEVLREWSPTPADQAFRDNLMSQANAGGLSTAQAAADIVEHARASTSVATLAYEFFTGSAPTWAGMDYLVSPTGPNPNNLNSAYYQNFSLENRYINFAVNLGKTGEGAANFASHYGSGDIYSAVHQAARTLFGADVSDAKAHELIDTQVTSGGQTMTRGQYFALYGGDGVNGVGTKAAMVGWLMAEAVKADVGTYAKSNDAFLTDVALHNAPFGVDIVGHYAQPGFVYAPG